MNHVFRFFTTKLKETLNVLTSTCATKQQLCHAGLSCLAPCHWVSVCPGGVQLGEGSLDNPCYKIIWSPG